MRWTLIVCVLMMTGCSTTPNTDQQWDRHYARQDAVEHKAWCLANDGVYIVDVERGNKCYSRSDWDQAMRNARL